MQATRNFPSRSPTGFAVRLAVLQEEWRVSEQFSAVGASEAFRVEVLSDGLQAVALDFRAALGARRGEILLETVFAVELPLLFDETEILKRTSALRSGANEMLRAPDFAQGCDKWASVREQRSVKRKLCLNHQLPRYFQVTHTTNRKFSSKEAILVTFVSWQLSVVAVALLVCK